MLLKKHRESGLSEEEAFEKAASAVGSTEEKTVAEAAFQQAIAEGADPREAVWAAEDAVREEFDRNRDFNRVGDDATSASIEEAIRAGRQRRRRVKSAIVGTRDYWQQDVRIAQEVKYQSLDEVFRTNDSEGISLIVENTKGTGKCR